MNVLVMRFSALGDVAMLSPVVREYALQHPEDSVTVLSVPFCAPLFEDIAPNVSFLGRAVKTQYRGIMGLFRLFKELHAMHFDRIVDAHDVLRTKVLRQYFRLSGYEVRVINKHRSERRQLTAEPGKKVLQQLPTSFENYAEALWGGDFSGLSGGSGFSGYSGVSGLSSDSSDSGDSGYSGVSGHSGLSSYSGDSGHLPQGGGREGAASSYGVAPFAAHKGKIYPTEKMEQVVEMLSHSGRVVLFGGKGEEEDIMRAWAKKYNNVELARDVISKDGGSVFSGGSGFSGYSGVSGCSGDSGPLPPGGGRVGAVGRTSGLAAELELMRGLDVMLSMDSANMHLASLVGTRVVSVWGATHPYAGFLGWGQRAEDCVQKDLPCRPCSIYGSKPCRYGDYRCLNSITPEEIVKAVTSKE